MAVEIPKDLITQLQISLRKQANVPFYDPNDSSLPTLPPFIHSTSDSPDLRCLHCKARLLRGFDSLLCIFCGKRPTNSETPPPHPIKFNSTSGYRWFLHSLNLDGSETVGESLDRNEWNKERREEFALSDLLDLEIRWNNAEPEESESGLRMNNPLNLAGLDFDDDFLAEPRGESVSIPSQGTLAVEKGIDSSGSKAFESHENRSLFESFQGSNSSGSVSGWQADFQFADSRIDQSAISSQSFDPFVGSSQDNSSQMDTVFGQGKNLFDGKDRGNQTSLESETNDWLQDDMKSKSISGDQAQIGAGNPIGKRTTDDDGDDDDDSFDAWNDFKGSTNAQDAAQSSSDQTADGSKTMHEKGGDSLSGLGAGSESTIFETHHECLWNRKRLVSRDSVFGTGKDSFQGKAIDNTTSSHTTNWFQDDLWSNSISGTLHHAEQSNENVGHSGILGNINNSSVSINRIQDDQWPLSSNKATDNGTNDEDDDSFGAWNDFKSSSILNSSMNSWNEHTICTSFTEEKSSDPFSGWDTDFQSANSKNNHEGSKSSDPFVGSSFDISDHMDTVFTEGKDLFDGKAKDSSNASNANSWFQDDRWSNSTAQLTRQAENLVVTVDIMDSGTTQGVCNSPSMDVDWFPDDQWLTGDKKTPDRKTVDESDNSSGDWCDFKSSNTTQDAFSNSLKQAARPDKQTIDDNNDLSAAWSDFTSSTSAKDPSSISFKQSLHHEKPSSETSEMPLFSMDSNSHNNSFGSLSQTDFFSGAFSNQNGSTEINIMQPGAPLSSRMADANARGGNNAEIAEDGDHSSATTGSKTDDIEILMSQMHDLSFMLVSHLSIPPKVDGCN